MMLVNDAEQDNSFFSEKIFDTGLSIYEVIRVFKGKPIFLKDNLLRLANSIKKSNIRLEMTDLHIQEKLDRLIRLEQIGEGNIKYVLHFQDGHMDEYIFQIPHAYPTKEDYEKGVDTLTCRAIRRNPEIKYINPELRALTNKLIRENQVYEVLLVDLEGFITEGSRSNVFFIKNDTLYTASVCYVLPGTSRKRVFDICKQLGISILENRIACSELADYEAAFITGTSPLILPIRKIDCHTFYNPQHPLLRQLMDCYFSLLETGD